MIEQSAIKFFKEIKKEKDNYKLVNGLFIVKYTNKDICAYVGEFLKSGSPRNMGRTNKVLISENEVKPLYNKKAKLRTTGLGVWKELNVKFIEKPIKEILK